MKKYLKVMLVLVVALSILCTFAFAANPFQDAMNAATSVGTGSEIEGKVNVIGGTVINTVQTIGYIVAVVMVLYVGIQWLIGTPAKKQELKGRMWSLVIGAILVAGGVTILGWVANIASTDLGVTTSSISMKA
ncbi:MAG: hypothetical protein E7314_01125 [Clostridiales bacterium]|nr:hypothetical protein [Clostridiales bacterium]